MDVENLIKTIIAAAIEVKRTLGSGFLENVYLNALVHELRLCDIPVETEKQLRIFIRVPMSAGIVPISLLTRE